MCGYEFCGECLVYAFGAKKPPYCIACAVAAAGIRSNAGMRPIADARELKALRKERRSLARRARRQPALPEPPLDSVPSMDDFGSGTAMPPPVLPANY